ncbi:hypothetical protein PILCRDRAFT_70226 [Piloderma croceum F 1598]|uniref:Carboxypeptidase n=1 Tax=Piloderma croceum (strain F 1598) TaxID=765440 RepID=A0A0C3FE58_PILCF|nr:hypothetical protein PILCRDRAFT_70226 [Piloderma croceum F 1598]
MVLSWSVALFSLAITRICAAPTIVNTTIYQQFTSRNDLGTKLRYVKDSGICETTPGVHQVSGYVDIGKNMSMFFWFFESRNSPEQASFTIWLNGGPGCSSMIGRTELHAHSEHGPCKVNPDGNSTALNPYRRVKASWNSVSNMLYVDQPVGTGLSHGTEDVNSTRAAAPPVWKTLQILFESGLFAKYTNRKLILATESYGGHYGPDFVVYFDEQNTKIDNGAIQGQKILISALMINNISGWFDPLLQYKSYVDFATNAPGYGQLQNDTILKQLNKAFYGKNGCKEREEACYAAGSSTASNKICATADNYCIINIFVPAIGDRDQYDLRQNASALFPPSGDIDYLANPSVLKKIGAEPPYNECTDKVGNNFGKTGDDARSLIPELAELVNAGLKTVIWVSQHLTINLSCNWLGGYAAMLAMDWYGKATLRNTPMMNMTINGKPVAAVQNVDNFSFARVFEAGHEIPAFKPAVALEIFSQVIHNEQLHSA